jgi:hypothetical protein
MQQHLSGQNVSFTRTYYIHMRAKLAYSSTSWHLLIYRRSRSHALTSILISSHLRGPSCKLVLSTATKLTRCHRRHMCMVTGIHGNNETLPWLIQNRDMEQLPLQPDPLACMAPIQAGYHFPRGSIFSGRSQTPPANFPSRSSKNSRPVSRITYHWHCVCTELASMPPVTLTLSRVKLDGRIRGRLDLSKRL